MKNTYNRHETAHLGITGDRYCELPDTFDLMADSDSPRSYLAYEVKGNGQRINSIPIRVKVDHEATGTHTTGTGDTVVRRV